MEIAVLGNAVGVIQKREGNQWRLQRQWLTCSGGEETPIESKAGPV